MFPLGTLFHTQLGLIPLLHNQSAAILDVHGGSHIAWILWLMMGFFTVSMMVMIATLFTDSKRYRTLHFDITVFYSVMNLAHVIADLLVRPIAWYQITLMAWLFAIELLLNLVSFQWMQRRHHKLLQERQMTL